MDVHPSQQKDDGDTNNSPNKVMYMKTTVTKGKVL